ncbi:Uncharacterised protein [Atlantibacter hermannii]|nr:Uncharacterised protein [Atlantibacter hermannii]
MKKRFSDEQIISILREARLVFPPVSSAVSMLFLTRPFTPGVRSLVAWKSLK